MPIVVTANPWQASATYIGYDNLLKRSDAVIVSTTQETGKEAQNAASWNGAQQWVSKSGTPQSITISLSENANCNSWGVYRHNFGAIGSAVTVTAEYSTDAVTWTTLGSAVTPGADDYSTIFQIHGSTVAARYFRLTISGQTAAVSIANLFFGESVQLYGSPDIGWTPTSVAFNDTITDSRSDGGNFVGRSIVRKAMMTSFNISVNDASWTLTTWRDIMEAIRAHPFYFSWDSVNYPTDVAFCWTEGAPSKPTFSAPNHMTIALSFHAIVNQLIVA